MALIRMLRVKVGGIEDEIRQVYDRGVIRWLLKGNQWMLIPFTPRLATAVQLIPANSKLHANNGILRNPMMAVGKRTFAIRGVFLLLAFQGRQCVNLRDQDIDKFHYLYDPPQEVPRLTLAK